MTTDEFWAKVDASGDCWIWTGRKNDKGYGILFWEGATRLAHRVAYELLAGPITEGLEPDHLCRVRSCVNPDHLELVTHRENCRRGVGFAGSHARATHCPQGHPYDMANTMSLKNGWRDCRECHKRITKVWADRNHAHLLEMQRARRARSK